MITAPPHAVAAERVLLLERALGRLALDPHLHRRLDPQLRDRRRKFSIAPPSSSPPTRRPPCRWAERPPLRLRERRRSAGARRAREHHAAAPSSSSCTPTPPRRSASSWTSHGLPLADMHVRSPSMLPRACLASDLRRSWSEGRAVGRRCRDDRAAHRHPAVGRCDATVDLVNGVGCVDEFARAAHAAAQTKGRTSTASRACPAMTPESSRSDPDGPVRAFDSSARLR